MRDLNKWIGFFYEMMCSEVNMTMQKVKNELIPRIKGDFVKLFKQEFGEEKKAVIKDCNFVGMTGAGLHITGEPL